MVQKQKVLITGASGFLGSWLVREFLENNYQVVALVRSKEKAWRINDLQNIEIIESDAKEWSSILAKQNPNIVISADWNGVEASARGEVELQISNVARILELANSAKIAGVEKFVHLGSQSELGVSNKTFQDDSQDNPSTEYAKAKVELRRQLLDCFKDSKTILIWARVFSVYGPMEDSKAMIPSLMRSVLLGQSFLTSSGNQEWSYLYASDFSAGVRLSVENCQTSSVFNVGNPISAQIKNVFEILVRIMPNGDLIKVAGLEDSLVSPYNLRVNPNFLIDLSWTPLIDLETGLRRTLGWWESNYQAGGFSLHPLK